MSSSSGPSSQRHASSFLPGAISSDSSTSGGGNSGHGGLNYTNHNAVHSGQRTQHSSSTSTQLSPGFSGRGGGGGQRSPPPPPSPPPHPSASIYTGGVGVGVGGFNPLFHQQQTQHQMLHPHHFLPLQHHSHLSMPAVPPIPPQHLQQYLQQQQHQSVVYHQQQQFYEHQRQYQQQHYQQPQMVHQQQQHQQERRSPPPPVPPRRSQLVTTQQQQLLVPSDASAPAAPLPVTVNSAPPPVAPAVIAPSVTLPNTATAAAAASASPTAAAINSNNSASTFLSPTPYTPPRCHPTQVMTHTAGDLLKAQVRDPARHLFEWTSLYTDHPVNCITIQPWNPAEVAKVLNGIAESKIELILNEEQHPSSVAGNDSISTSSSSRSSSGNGGVRDSTRVVYPVPARRHELDAPPSCRSGHTTTFVPKLNSLFVFGGTASPGGSDGYHDEVYQLEVHTGKWFLLDTLGVAAPATFGHTTNLMASGLHLFVYGGQGSNYVVGGFAWYLDLVTCLWRNEELSRPAPMGKEPLQDSDVRRWGHSMVPLSAYCGPPARDWMMPEDDDSAEQDHRSTAAPPVQPPRELFLIFAGMNDLTAKNDLLCIDVQNNLVVELNVAPPAVVTTVVTPPATRPHRAPQEQQQERQEDRRAGFGTAIQPVQQQQPQQQQQPHQQRHLIRRPQPPPRRRHTACLFKEDYMIIFGGRNMTKFWNDLWVLHLPTRIWVPIHRNTSPSSLRHFYGLSELPSLELASQKLNQQLLNRDGHLPHCQSNEHSLIGAPPPRTGHSAFLLRGDQMYVVSGFEVDGVYDDCYGYDISQNKWSVVSLGETENCITKGNNAVTAHRHLEESSSQQPPRPSPLPAYFLPRSMGTATVLAPTSTTGAGANPLVFFYGGRNLTPLGDCMVLRVYSKPSSLFRLLSQFIVDHKADLWDNDSSASVLARVGSGLGSGRHGSSQHQQQQLHHQILLPPRRDQLPHSVRSEVLELGGAPVMPPKQQQQQAPYAFYQSYPATPSG